ncbi:MAG: FHA domain-containing protein, partial [Candidatus Eremiobacterota bacterium]
ALTRNTTLCPVYRLRVEGGPMAGRNIPLFSLALQEGRALTMGGPGAQPNDLDLEDPSVPCRVAALEWAAAGLQLVNLTCRPDQVRVNDLPVPGRIALHGGEQVQVGQTWFRVEPGQGDPGPSLRLGQSKPGRARSRFVLEVCSGSQPGLVELGESTTLGRGPECDLRLPHETVSRRHCRIVRWEGSYRVRPVGGGLTLINGLPLEDERELRHGDRLQLGEATVVRFLDQTRG